MILEIVYVWPNGREEVRYTREPADSEDAKKLIQEVEDLKSWVKDCPYFWRIK